MRALEETGGGSGDGFPADEFSSVSFRYSAVPPLVVFVISTPPPTSLAEVPMRQWGKVCAECMSGKFGLGKVRIGSDREAVLAHLG